MMVTVDKPTERDLRFILANLRELDQVELTATGANFEILPSLVLHGSAFAFVAVDDRLPVAAWGMIKTRDGVGAGFAFGTKYWGRALPQIMKNIKRYVLPFLLTQGYHRVECSALAHRDDVARFLGLIGARPEAVLQQYGTKGEDFILYRWLADEHRAATSDDQHIVH
jgi:hypothetical protein